MVLAAEMSGWWVLGFCVPGLNILAQILWAINVVKVRQKSVWVTVALLLPVFNLVGFIYLAFSSAEEETVESKPVKPLVARAVPQQA